MTPKLIDIPGAVLAQLDPETREDVRRRLIAEVMEQHQVVSSAWSLIDGPFAGDDSIHEHGRLKHELENLVARVVHLPDSVEGLRYLERWYSSRRDQLATLHNTVAPGVVVQFDNGGGDPTKLELNEDMAKGMRIALIAAQSLFSKFPLALEHSPASYDPDDDDIDG